MSVEKFGALILFSPKLEACVAFYRALGLELENEEHEGGPLHYACEIGPVHFAIYESGTGTAPEPRSGGSSLLGFQVNNLGAALAAARAAGHAPIGEPEERPWGRRAIVPDPDGRAVELWQQKSPSA